ncbi:MAG TPA: glycosyltransferase [Candidatus Binatia bacterium]|jgi:hypothetical protein|nr:glycosyltransferase [Candidatus Binatia bacterium]
MRQGSQLVVLGIMGRTPLAGVAWQVLHYLEGFRRLGFDVHYIEDTGDWSYDPEQNTVTDNCTYTVNYISELMARYGLSDRWAYRAAAHNGRTFGLSESQVLRVFERADALINLTGSTVLRAEHLRVPVRIYLETDPVLPQIEVAKGSLFHIDLLNGHTHHFTYGENLGAPDCGVPVGRFDYRPTRQPVVLDWWTPTTILATSEAIPSSTACFTTIANWRQSDKDLEWNGETYTWSKHQQFLQFIDLPDRTMQPLELALALQGSWEKGQKAWVPLHKEDAEAIRLLTSCGWRIINGLSLSRSILSYRDYILGSRGEFTVAKDQYTRLRSGWFSDRSACYLAAGRPVVTQDTGFGKFFPTGEGLFAFNTMEEIVAAFEAINADYERHSRAARNLAAEHFSADRVLSRLLQDAGLG